MAQNHVVAIPWRIEFSSAGGITTVNLAHCLGQGMICILETVEIGWLLLLQISDEFPAGALAIVAAIEQLLL